MRKTEGKRQKNVITNDSEGLSDLENSTLAPQAAATSACVCRICLGEQTDDSDPLISPCKCKGSMKHIHLVCLQTWIRSKLNVKEENNSIITIIWKNLSCELCKEKLPLTYNLNGKELDILLFNSQSNKFMVMESLSKDRTPNGIHIIDFTHKQTINIVLTFVRFN